MWCGVPAHGRAGDEIFIRGLGVVGGGGDMMGGVGGWGVSPQVTGPRGGPESGPWGVAFPCRAPPYDGGQMGGPRGGCFRRAGPVRGGRGVNGAVPSRGGGGGGVARGGLASMEYVCRTCHRLTNETAPV